MDVYIKQGSIIAKLAAQILGTKQMAVTINNRIYLYNCSKENFLQNKKWVCHEIAHVMQYKRMRTLKFIIAYVAQCLVNGYTKNKFEKEAREKENDVGLIEAVSFI